MTTSTSESLCATSDYYTKNVIPADVYGTDGDVTTVAVGAVILARDDVSEDAIYNFTKDLFDNAEAEVSSHAKYGELNPRLCRLRHLCPVSSGRCEVLRGKRLHGRN